MRAKEFLTSHTYHYHNKSLARFDFKSRLLISIQSLFENGHAITAAISKQLEREDCSFEITVNIAIGFEIAK